MYERYGDVVLLDGDDAFSRAIRFFNGQRYVHCGVLVERGVFSQLNRKGEEIFLHLDDKRDHNSYIILKHREATLAKRDLFKRNYEELVRTHDYDMLAILKLAAKHTLVKCGIGFPEEINILREGMTMCSALTSLGHELTYDGFKVRKGVHFSQTEPHHFLETFETVENRVL